MQVDIHYYGVFVLAKLAGLKDDICEKIAFSSQFVDDNVLKIDLGFKENKKIILKEEHTAHHGLDMFASLSKEDQKNIWIPFHFLPGNQGSSFEERIICRKDSKLANDMIEEYLNYDDEVILPYLIGIMAHVYADTFSHYGFSGISSKENRVINGKIKFYNLNDKIEKYIIEKANNFYINENNGLHLELFMGTIIGAISGALGHAEVATYPDRPYLNWSYTFSHSKEYIKRENRNDYLEYCEKLYNIFVHF